MTYALDLYANANGYVIWLERYRFDTYGSRRVVRSELVGRWSNLTDAACALAKANAELDRLTRRAA